MAQMLFFSGVIKQEDKKFLINPFEKLVGEPVCLDAEDYVCLTAESYDKLTNVLDLAHREPMCVAYIDAQLNADSGLIDLDQINFVEDKLDLEDEAKLDMFKEKTIRMMNELIASQKMISNFELFHFFKANQYLNSKGFFITDENREEKYLEVINSDDTDLLRVLSEYIDCLDEFNAIDDVYMKFKEYKDKVKSATTFKEVEEAYYELSAKLF